MNRSCERFVEVNMQRPLQLLDHLDGDELKELITNDDKFDHMLFNELDNGFEQTKNLMIATNKSAAEYNLSLAPKLEVGKMQLKDLSQQGSDICSRIEEKRRQLRDEGGSLSADSVLALLQTAAAESEEESEKVAEQFYQKDITVEEFINLFETHRKQMHLRRVKADKMKDLMRAQPPQVTRNVLPYPT